MAPAAPSSHRWWPKCRSPMKPVTEAGRKPPHQFRRMMSCPGSASIQPISRSGRRPRHRSNASGDGGGGGDAPGDRSGAQGFVEPASQPDMPSGWVRGTPWKRTVPWTARGRECPEVVTFSLDDLDDSPDPGRSPVCAGCTPTRPLCRAISRRIIIGPPRARRRSSIRCSQERWNL